MRLDNHKKLDDSSVAIEKSIKEEKAERYFVDAEIRPNANHTMYEINAKDKTISIAEYKEQEVVEFGKEKNSPRIKSILRKPNCWYFPSLNIKNVKRKLAKFGFPDDHFKYIPAQQEKGKGFKISMIKTEKVK